MATNVRWYGAEYKARLERHIRGNLDMAAQFLVADIQKSFGSSGVTGTRSGATKQQRAANRSKPWGPPNVDNGHLKGNIGYDTPGGRREVRRVGTGIGNKKSVGYAMWLEFGTRPGKVIMPKTKKALFWPGAEHPVTKVISKGILPRPFLRPALWRNKLTLRRMITRPMV